MGLGLGFGVRLKLGRVRDGLGLGLGFGWVGIRLGLGYGWVGIGTMEVNFNIGTRLGGWLAGWLAGWLVQTNNNATPSAQQVWLGLANRAECGNIPKFQNIPKLGGGVFFLNWMLPL